MENGCAVPMPVNNQEFVSNESAWLLDQCLKDLREAQNDPNAKYEAILTTCENVSTLVKKLDTMGTVEDEGTRASHSEIPMETVVLLGKIAAGQMRQCPDCGGWHPIEPEH